MLFLRNVGRLLSRGHIRESVWGPNAVVTSRTLDTHVSRIRNKLGLTPENGWRLAAVYRYGYRLEQLDASPRTPRATTSALISQRRSSAACKRRARPLPARVALRAQGRCARATRYNAGCPLRSRRSHELLPSITSSSAATSATTAKPAATTTALRRCATTPRAQVKELGLAGPGKVRVNQAGCLDRCEEGPVIVVYPGGGLVHLRRPGGHRRDHRRASGQRPRGRAAADLKPRRPSSRLLLDGAGGHARDRCQRPRREPARASAAASR